MIQFRVTLNCEPGKVSSNDLKVILRDVFMQKIKEEGVDFKVWPIEVEEISNVRKKT